MRKISIILLLVIFILGSSTSCRKKAFVVDGLAPVYISPIDFSYIKRSSPRTLKNIGQSLQYNNYLFINEIYNGIHVFDNTDPKAPKPIHFWEIPGNLDLSIKDSILYADNSVHLLVIDISDFMNIKVINHFKDLHLSNPVPFPVPPNFSGFFECINKSKGIQVDWQLTQLIDPLCKTI